MRILIILFMLLLIVSCCKKNLKNDIQYEKSNDKVIEKVKEPLAKDNEGMKLGKDVLRPRDKKYWQILYTIHFDLNSYYIKPVESMSLNGYSDIICKSDSIVLIGGCCPLGTEKYNYNLGYERAIAVGNALRCINSGLQIISVGEKKLLCESPDCYEQNRRCEIYVRR